MKKNGFTLIELLAVIVILAIIALIATPIILGIINDAREESNERSVELYASAVRNAVAAYQLTGTKAPESFEDLNIQYDGNVECATKELYSDGSFYLEGCKVNGGEKEYSYGTKQTEVGKMSICNPLRVQTEGAYTTGDKYECDVDPNKEGYDYMFYVLNSTVKEVNLIMDSNINISGEAVKDSNMSDKGIVAWNAETGVAEDGPITAMNYLLKATKNWTNLNKISFDKLEDFTGVTHNIEEYVGYARMPYWSEFSTGDWIYNYLAAGGNQENVVSDVSGYWTLSVLSETPTDAWVIDSIGGNFLNVSNSLNYGVRPVIILEI